ncbi:hypothetical protein ACLB2K_033148 [Fragaria x ananassa]
MEIPEFNVSYKRQKISPKFTGTVRDWLHTEIRDLYTHPQFVSDGMKPLLLKEIIDQQVQNLSGGEQQRVAICQCLGKLADIYLIDEPSAYLDSEQRIIAAKVIKRQGYCLEGTPSVDCTANAPQSLLAGMNIFLSHLDITFRCDLTNYRPRISKLNSTKDTAQQNARFEIEVETSAGLNFRFETKVETSAQGLTYWKERNIENDVCPAVLAGFKHGLCELYFHIASLESLQSKREVSTL